MGPDTGRSPAIPTKVVNLDGKPHLPTQAPQLFIGMMGRDELESLPDGRRHPFPSGLSSTTEEVCRDLDSELLGGGSHGIMIPASTPASSMASPLSLPSRFGSEVGVWVVSPRPGLASRYRDSLYWYATGHPPNLGRVVVPTCNELRKHDTDMERPVVKC